MKLVDSLIGWEVTVGQGPEFHLTFVRGIIIIIIKELFVLVSWNLCT